jgi:4-diphosphocytidyl-2-C-methyl-D-erythritol kinase
MIYFPKCKINLGLNIVRKRPDGYHDLETVFYPVALTDALEIVAAADGEFGLTTSGLPVPGDFEANLCVKAYRMLAADHPVPPVKMHLHKAVPMGAGLGGGSSDGAAALCLLNDLFGLSLTTAMLEAYAARLGSDCAFFVKGVPVLATGRGEIFEPVDVDLSGYHLAIVKPPVHMSTAEAYSLVQPSNQDTRVKEIIKSPIQDWQTSLVNDFEPAISSRFPVVGSLKALLIRSGAIYASMTGSGSAVYGIFKDQPVIAADATDFVFICPV